MHKLSENSLRSANMKQSALRKWGLYLLTLALWAAAVPLLAYTAAIFFVSMTRLPSPLYELLHLIAEYLPAVIILCILAGWIIISYFFIARPEKNLELLLAGAEKLAHPTDEPIHLPENMKGAEAQLNLVRERALWNARAAQDAEQRKNDLVVYLAHDLKTPLTSVIGYLTLLRDEPQLSPELRARYTHIALDKAEHLEDLVNEFFDITRFNLSHLELQLQDTDLRRMLEQVCSEMGPVLHQRDLRCKLLLPDVFRAVCDPDKMARVFDNLLNNACHYAYAGSVLQIEGHTQSDQLVMIFRNAGATIPPEKLSRMFEQFFRLDPARNTRSGNAGLGLAIAKEIVEAHGGTIAAQSRDEQVTFTLTLPLKPAP